MSEKMTQQLTVLRTDRGLSIAGTRITLYSLMDYVKADWPPKLIRDRFDLTDQQISDVMEYITTHRDDIEAEYQLVLQQAEEDRKYWEERNQKRFAEIAAIPPKPDQERIRAKLQVAKTKLGLL